MPTTPTAPTYPSMASKAPTPPNKPTPPTPPKAPTGPATPVSPNAPKPPTAPITPTTPTPPEVILQLLFDRPTEPIIMPRGDNASNVFDVPDGYLNERVRIIRDKIAKRFEKPGRTNIPIGNISVPDLTIPMKIGKNDTFSLFIPAHRDIAGNLIDMFMAAKTVQDLIATAAYCHDRINPYLFNYGLSVALLHRPDTKEVSLPNFLQCFPGKFVDGTVFQMTREEAVMVPKEVREPIVIPRSFTASDKEPEQATAYFREDLGINLHHWHWHLVYPFAASDISIVAKDRRGELFYYMHQQVLARYNAERFSNNMLRVKSYNNLREPILEGYFPKLQVLIASRAWPSRQANTSLSDVNRTEDQLAVKISDLELWTKNLNEAVTKGVAIDRQGKEIPLSEDKGIDILGDMIEASMLSPNRPLYGSLHNFGHVLTAACHDPDGRFMESFAVMSDTTTAMRDPFFYRWHNNINDIFLMHKNKLPQYTEAQLDYKGVRVTDLQITVDNKSPNQLFTFWQQSEVDFSRGLDFAPRSPVFVRFTHLQHEEFNFVVKVNNATPKRIFGTMRLFMAPRLNDKGEVMKYNEQKNLMIELDRFKVILKQGDNVIKRSSLDSSVTIPYERTFRNLDAGRPMDEEPGQTGFNFCGCGWPQHMLIPKGTTKGMVFDLFAMVSNYDNDKIEQDITGACSDADSYCGVQDRKYPDKQAMGYPFDRMGRAGVDTLSKFLTPNMKVTEVIVTFTDKTVPRNQPPAVSVIPMA